MRMLLLTSWTYFAVLRATWAGRSMVLQYFHALVIASGSPFHGPEVHAAVDALCLVACPSVSFGEGLASS